MDIKRIDISEFREFGFLQEVNRQFFHPLGLALETVIEDDGTERLGGVWDYRDDPEGMSFVRGAINPVKVDRVDMLRRSKEDVRYRMFGSVIQQWYAE